MNTVDNNTLFSYSINPYISQRYTKTGYMYPSTAFKTLKR